MLKLFRPGRRAFRSGLLVACASASLWAQSSKSFTVSLSAAGTTTATFADAQNHTIQVNVSSPSACALQLEGSLDGTNWSNLSGSQSCLNNAMFHVDGKPVGFVRVNLTSYTGASSVTIFYKGGN